MSARLAPGSLGKTFAAIAAEEEGHIDHAMEILRAERALDPQRFDDKVYRLHLDVMTTLAEMLTKECRNGHCEVCHGSCVKPSLPDGQPICSRASRSVAATVSEDARQAGDTRRGDTHMGDSVAGVARRGREVDFALIGHQESWRAAADVLAVLRGPQHTPLPDDEIKDILPWIPPRAVCHVDVGSIAGAKAHGVYIDSFIPPDRLEAAYMHDNIARVRGAAAYAIKAGAKIVSLGGFSSILIEGNFDQLPERHDTVFTTGNTLTVAFIVQGIQKMCALEGRNLRRSTLLIVGATGDVGSGCARCLAPFVKRVLLSARNLERLRKLAAELEADGVQVEIATGSQQFSAEADIVICAASLASSFPSVGPHLARRNRVRCGLPQEPLPKRADA